MRTSDFRLARWRGCVSAAALTIACGAVAAVCGGQPAQNPTPTVAQEPAVTDPELLKVLEEIDSRAAKVTDLTADFEQRKFTPLLKKPLVSSGKLRVKGSVVRWDTAKPEPSVMRIDERELKLYYPDQKVVEVYPIGEDMRRLSSSPLPRLESIRSQFSIARTDAKALDADADPSRVVAILLTPTAAGLKEHVASVKVLLDIASACAMRMEMTDPDGERTLMVFSRIRINAGVSDAELELTLPEGVKVVRPLEGMSPPAKGSPGDEKRGGDRK